MSFRNPPQRTAEYGESDGITSSPEPLPRALHHPKAHDVTVAHTTSPRKLDPEEHDNFQKLWAPHESPNELWRKVVVVAPGSTPDSAVCINEYGEVSHRNAQNILRIHESFLHPRPVPPHLT